jgi:hypothetical protein
VKETRPYIFYIITVICVFWLLGSGHALVAGLFGVKDSVELTLDSIASIVGIASAAIAIIISNRLQARKEQQASRDQIYQQLELESNNLFRFEVENVKVARIVWDEEVTTFDRLQEDKDLAYKVLAYICQILNLMEMAVRFRKNGIAHEDVYRSWEIWIFDLCKSEIFLNYWFLKGVREHYIGSFQAIIEDGLNRHHREKIGALSKRGDRESGELKEFRRVVKKRLKRNTRDDRPLIQDQGGGTDEASVCGIKQPRYGARDRS